MAGAHLRTEFQLKPWDRADEFITDVQPGADGYYPAVRPTRAAAVIPMLVATYEAMPDRLWLALSSYVTNATGAAFEDDAVTRYHLKDGYVVSPLVQLSAAYKLNDEWTVGAGVGALNVRVHGNRFLFPIVDSDNDPSTPPTDLSSIFGKEPDLTIDGTDWKLAWNAGVLARPTKKLSLGAAVIARVDPMLDGHINVVPSEDGALAGENFDRIGHTGLVLPWTFHAGANYDVHPQVEAGVDFRYWLYRQYEQQRTVIDEGLFGVNELVTPKNFHDAVQLSGGDLLRTVFCDATYNQTADSMFLKGHLPSEISIYSLKCDFTKTFRSGLRIETGIKASYVKSDNLVDYVRKAGNNWVADKRNNHFIYDDNVNAAYVNVAKEIRKWNMQGGLRMENTNTKGVQISNNSTVKRSYVSLFPSAFVSYNASKKNMFTVSVSRRLQRPNYQDLNPFTFFLDSLSYRQGNPYLTPQFSWNYELKHTFNGKLTTTLNYTTTNDVISQIIKRTKGTNNEIIGFLTIDNIARFDNMGIAVSTPVKLAKWWNVRS